MNIYFLFNKNTKEFIGFTFEESSVSPHLLYRVGTITNEEDIKDISWEGDYETGRMIRLGDSEAIVTEYDLEGKFYDRMFRKYGVEKIIELLLDYYSSFDELDGPAEFKNLIEFHKKNRKKLNDEINFFKGSHQHTYISKEEDKKKVELRFKV